MSNDSGVSYEMWGRVGEAFSDMLHTGLDGHSDLGWEPWQPDKFVFPSGYAMNCAEWTSTNGFWHSVTDSLMFAAVQATDKLIYKHMENKE